MRMKHHIRPRRRAAFSLAELTLVVVIIGIMGAIAMPRLAAAIANRRIASAAQRLALDLAQARQMARIKSTPVTLTFFANGTYSSPEMTDPDKLNATFSVSLADPPYLVDALAADFDGSPSVTFDMYGQPNVGGVIKIRVGERQEAVAVDAETGQAKALTK